MGGNTRLFGQYNFVISADVKCFARTVPAGALAVQAAAAYSWLYGLVLNNKMGSENCLHCAPCQYTSD